MSHQIVNYKEQFLVECKMSTREYYDFRLLAMTHKVQFTVKWEQTYCVITTEAPFLAKCGYTAGVDF
jgi:hypothetical protein